MSKMYNAKQAAEVMGVNYGTFMNWIHNPDIPLDVQRLSRVYVITEEALEEFKQYRENNPDQFTPGRPPNEVQITKTIITEDGEKKRVHLDYKNRREALLGEDE